MKSFIRLTQFTRPELERIFRIAGSIPEYTGFLNGKTVVLFFPGSSIRTRVTFEKGIFLLGGQSVLFPPETLDKKEDIRDVCGYLNNWADAVVVRHRDIRLLDRMVSFLQVPLINAMTDDNHPCEMMSDLHTLSQRRRDYLKDQYLFVGPGGNIGKAWKEASEAFGFRLTQCCPPEYRMPDTEWEKDLEEAVKGKDIICTDSLPERIKADFADYQVTAGLLGKANSGAVLNPCPPFYRGDEVSEDAIDSPAFAGYEFKKSLLAVQQAVMIYCMGDE